MFTFIDVDYQARYNGAFVNNAEDIGMADQQIEELCDAISNGMHEDCDDDGECMLGDSAIIKKVTAIVKQMFGDAVEVKVNVDNMSS